MARRKVLEAIEPHAVEIGGESWLIKRGERLASNHPAVRQNPQCFAESGGATSVIRPQKREPKAPPPKPEPMMRAKREMIFCAGALRDGAMFIREGDVLAALPPSREGSPQGLQATQMTFSSHDRAVRVSSAPWLARTAPFSCAPGPTDGHAE